MAQDKFYDVVAGELRQKIIQDGIWTRAYAEADGNESRARAIYIKFRVAQLAKAEKESLREAELKKELEQIAREQREAKQRNEESIQIEDPKKIEISILIVFIIAVIITAFFVIVKVAD